MKQGRYILLIPLMLLGACVTRKEAEARLLPRRTGTEIRIQDIEKNVETNPTLAIQQIGVFDVLYGRGSGLPEDLGTEETIAACREQATAALGKAQTQAIEENRWADAASLARSLEALGVNVDRSGEEPDLMLEYARQQLAGGNNLGAFLAAVQSHEARSLEAEDALLFLQAAVKARQRGTAQFFLSILDGSSGEAGLRVDPEWRSFAEGKDSPTDMIGGVATVIVDRGVRIERGRGFPDRVLGSAFFVDASGLLITNYHVIASEVDPTYEGYSRLYVRIGDSSSPRVPGKVLGWDRTMDLALIKAEYSPEYVFSIVDRVSPRVGDTVYAIGSPGGLEKTVTQGIVSALGRRFLQIGDVIQIDAAVNPGNSGGPVVDMQGRLVGIVFAGVEQFQGLNFAVPAERLTAALPALLAGGKAVRPWLGLTLSEGSQGVEILYVAPLTPAGDQQIKEGDVIKRINGQEPQGAPGSLIAACQDMLFTTRAGELVSLELAGPEGELENRVLMSVPRPDVPLGEAARRDTRERMAAPLFGIVLTPEGGKSMFASYLIKRVIRGSIADEAGLSANDPLSIRGFKVFEKEGYALLDIDVKKRRMGYLETTMEIGASLESPDTL